MTDAPTPVVPRRYLAIFTLLVSCFALWGLLNNMTDNLVPAFQKIFMTSQSTAGYVQVSFYGAYSVIALFASPSASMHELDDASSIAQPPATTKMPTK